MKNLVGANFHPDSYSVGRQSGETVHGEVAGEHPAEVRMFEYVGLSKENALLRIESTAEQAGQHGVGVLSNGDRIER